MNKKIAISCLLGLTIQACKNYNFSDKMSGNSNIQDVPVLCRYSKEEANFYKPMDQTKKLAILVGGTGEGKTTLFNTLCNTVAESGENAHGMTVNLFKEPVAYGPRFDIVDSPGLDDMKDSFTPSYLVKKTLETSPYNSIFLLVPFVPRADKLVDNFMSACRPFKNHMDKVVIMISKWDMCKEPHTFKGIVIKEFSDYKYMNQIIFYSKYSDPKVISSVMFNAMSNMPAKVCKFGPNDFYKFFNLKSVKDNLKRPYKLFEQRLEDEYRRHVALSKEYNSHEDMDEIQHFLLIHFKDIANKLEEDLIKEYGESMQQFEDYRFFIDLKSKCMFYIDSLNSIMESIDGTSMIDRMLRKMLKKCPYCGTVWSKVATDGCNGRTTCGKKGIGSKDIDPNQFIRMKAVYDEEYFIQSIEFLSKNKAKSTSRDGSKELVTSLGCGKDFIWDGSSNGTTKGAIPLTKEEFSRYREIVPEELVETITKKPNYKKFEEKAIREIDTSFHRAQRGESSSINPFENYGRVNSKYTNSFLNKLDPIWRDKHN